MKFGYARISTKSQNLDMQMDGLIRAGVDKENIFTDVSSGVKTKRDGFDSLCMKVRKGDEVIVWKLDRLARSVSHITRLIEGWETEGIEFRSISEPFFDTKSSHGKFVFTMFGAMAELERNIIVERTKAGLEAAKERGRVGGRKKGLSKAAKNKAIIVERLYNEAELGGKKKYTIEEIMEIAEIRSRATIYNYLRYRKELKEKKGKEKKKSEVP